MLPAHVGGPESAVFWILAWFDRLGGTYAPDDPVRVFQDATGTIVRIQVEGVVTFADGARLEVALELDGRLECRRAFFDRFDPTGARTWGWHHHPERRGADHRHDAPGFHANPPTRRRSSWLRRCSTPELGRPRSALPMVAPLGNGE